MKNIPLILGLTLILMLSGCAGLFIAGAASTANVVLDNRSTEIIWIDTNIEFEVSGLMNKPPYRGKARIVANSYRGIVVLMGQASSPELLASFEQDLHKIKDVKTIHNQVRIRNPLDVADISKDSWITTKVKSTLLTNEKLNGVKIKVITEDKEVFLLGYVSHQNGDIAAEAVRNISGVKQIIKAFQYGD
jgi:osmotically-inducible protein OsmY